MEPIRVYDNPPRDAWPALTARVTRDDAEIDRRVAAILNEVRTGGDEALRRIARRIDGFAPERFELPQAQLDEAARNISPELKTALATAKANIEAFHRAQLPRPVAVEVMPGVRCSQRAVAIRRVGLYVPGGSAPLFSTVLMLAVPAAIAGCAEIVLCTPAGRDGSIAPEIRYAAALCGVRRVFALGGAQAVAAMAYGTESVPRVDKIFGPGNRYVTRAKQLVGAEGTAIDLPAGPSEVLVLADEGASPDFAAADLLSQAEHGADSQAVLVCRTVAFARRVNDALRRQTAVSPRNAILRESLAQSRIVVFDSQDDMLDFAEAYAPEHLIIETQNYRDVAEQIVNAGSVFMGPYAPESAGDYASGTNHTLPTNGYAKAYSGVSLDSFIRKITFQEITKEGIRRLGPAIQILAANEQLDAHKNAVTVRLD